MPMYYCCRLEEGKVRQLLTFLRFPLKLNRQVNKVKKASKGILADVGVYSTVEGLSVYLLERVTNNGGDEITYKRICGCRG